MRRVWYDVRPRYTPGSPGLVDQETAERVANAERAAYIKKCGPPLGRDDALRGIVWSWFQSRNVISWHDLLTDSAGAFRVKTRDRIRWPWDNDIVQRAGRYSHGTCTRWHSTRADAAQCIRRGEMQQ